MAKKRTAKTGASSLPETRVVRSDADINRYLKSSRYRRDLGRARVHSAEHGGEPSAEDLAEIPELTEGELNSLRPLKRQLTIRIDADILDWLKQKPGPYQTRLNNSLRWLMLREREVATRKGDSRKARQGNPHS